MKILLTIVYIVVVISYQVNIIDGLRCYNCSDCNDTFSSGNPMVTCPTDGNYSCFKLKAAADGAQIVFRGCGKNCIFISEAVGTVSSALHCCDSDLCNGDQGTYGQGTYGDQGTQWSSSTYGQGTQRSSSTYGQGTYGDQGTQWSSSTYGQGTQWSSSTYGLFKSNNILILLSSSLFSLLLLFLPV